MDGVENLAEFERVWFRDLNPSADMHLFRRLETLLVKRSAFQTIEIARMEPLGRCLLLDGHLQSSELDERLYHELLVHPALLVHPHPRRVLILGGGEGATLREVLRHPTVEEAVMVDLDEEVVRICRQYLPTWHQGAFDDPRVRLVIQEVQQYLSGLTETGGFDVIIGDLTDPGPVGPAGDLYQQSFLRLVASRLEPSGILALQSGNARYFFDDAPGQAVAEALQDLFPAVVPYAEYILSFDCVWLFIMAGSFDRASLSADTIERRAAERRLQFQHYGPAEHRHVFGWPFLSRWVRIGSE